MSRRLFFLFPDEVHAQSVVDELAYRRVPKRRIHAIARGVQLKTLPEATERQKRDTTFRVENFLWKANLVVFVLALLAFVATLVMGNLFGIVVSASIMLLTFFAGEQFVVHVPDVHLTEFTDALGHGEVLLMVDVPRSRALEIDYFVRHSHPEAVTGGVGWSVDAFGM